MVSSHFAIRPIRSISRWVRPSAWHYWLTALAVVALAGCDAIRNPWNSAPPPTERPTDTIAVNLARVSAQGVLKPLGGVLPLIAPPGDRVAKVFVRAGQQVESGDPLVELQSRTVREIELDVARIKIAEAERRIAAERAAAEARLNVARTGLKQAETELEQARRRLQAAQAEGGSLDLLRRTAELGERKLQQLREAAENPSTTRLVTETKLEEEALRTSEVRAAYEKQKQEAQEAILTGELQLEAARQELQVAELAMKAAEAGQPIDSLKRQVELLQLQVDASRLLSPLGGTVLSVDAIVGQATTTMPLMHLADTSEVVCEAEVNVGDLPEVSVGQSATITSPGLVQPLRGTVTRIQPMVATPQLANPFPMAPVNRHASIVIIRIHPDDVPAAAAMLQLQVEVSIDVSSEKQSANLSAAFRRRTVSARTVSAEYLIPGDTARRLGEGHRSANRFAICRPRR